MVARCHSRMYVRSVAGSSPSAARASGAATQPPSNLCRRPTGATVDEEDELLEQLLAVTARTATLLEQVAQDLALLRDQVTQLGDGGLKAGDASEGVLGRTG